VRIDYIVAKAERGYTKGEKAAIGGGLAAGLGGMVGEHVNVERHNYALNRGRQAAGGWTPEAKRVMRTAKRNVWASRGIYGAGTLATLGGVVHRANRLNRSES
jgi:hypothetical protein